MGVIVEIEDKIVLEIKAIPSINNVDVRQLIGYLKRLGKELGILANFRGPRLVYKRVLNPEIREHSV